MPTWKSETSIDVDMDTVTLKRADYLSLLRQYGHALEKFYRDREAEIDEWKANEAMGRALLLDVIDYKLTVKFNREYLKYKYDPVETYRFPRLLKLLGYKFPEPKVEYANLLEYARAMLDQGDTSYGSYDEYVQETLAPTYDSETWWEIYIRLFPKGSVEIRNRWKVKIGANNIDIAGIERGQDAEFTISRKAYDKITADLLRADKL